MAADCDGRAAMPPCDAPGTLTKAVGTPRNWRKAVKAVQDSQGFYISVSDSEILNAMKTLGNVCGIFGEPAGVTGLAGVIKAARKGMIPPDASVSAIISGSGLKDVVSAQRAAGTARRIPPDAAALEDMKQRGLLEEKDGRFTMAPSGREKFLAVLSATKAFEADIADHFTPGELAEMKTLLRRVIALTANPPIFEAPAATGEDA